jgi:hypothetical protein
MNDPTLAPSGNRQNPAEPGNEEAASTGTQADGLTPRQEKAIICLLSSPSIAKAAEKAEVSERAVRNWLRDETFLKAYRVSRRTIYEQSVARLQRAAGRAVRTLVDCLKTGNRVSDRIRAAVAILSLGSEGIRQWDVQQQLIELERLMKDVQAKQRGQRP